jgi:uncharacterized protein (TIGR02147 family)
MIDPPISEAEAKRAIKLLEKTKIIRRRDDGVYELTDAVITSGYEVQSVSLTNHVLNSLEQAAIALEHFPRDERNLSTVSVSISPKGYEKIVQELRAFRRRVLDIAREDADVNRAYQFNFQIFPLSKPYQGPKK